MINCRPIWLLESKQLLFIYQFDYRTGHNNRVTPSIRNLRTRLPVNSQYRISENRLFTGINGNKRVIIKNFPSDRTFKAYFSNSFSASVPQYESVLQECVLNIALFLFAIVSLILLSSLVFDCSYMETTSHFISYQRCFILGRRSWLSFLYY